MVLCGSLLGGAFSVGQDSWIAVLFIGVFYLPLILIYSRICSLFPGKNLFDIIQDLFGNIGGALTFLLLTFYTVIVTALQLRNFTELTAVVSLNETPKIPIMIILLLPVMYIAKGGITLIGRWAIITCAIIVINIFLTLIFSFNIIDITNLLPMMDHSFTEISSDAFSLGAIAVGETVMVMGLMGQLQKKDSPYKVFLPGVLIGVGLFALVLMRNILVLGTDLEQEAKFSTYMAVRIINVGSFFERVESLISLSLILLGFTKMAVFLSTASMGAARLFKIENHTRFIIPISLLILAVGSIVFKSAFEMYETARVYWAFALPFQVLIPVALWVTAEIKVRKGRNADFSAITQAPAPTQD
ncbi:MAG TPA: endospore germination permease [Clostridiales bacterium]|nr:endospore germination permease [Clostridiales bacterium]